jgi:hypothetical protein
LVSELNSALTEITPSVSADGLRIWFYSGREPDGIWRSTRASRGAAWAPPEPVPDLVLPAETMLVIGPSLDESERMLAVAVLRVGGMAWDLYSATRATSDASFTPLLAIPGVNGPDTEHDPFLVNQGRELLFSSTRAGAGDLFWARRADILQPFSEPVALDELNVPDFLDSDPFLSADHSTIFFASTRSGVADIYEADVLSYE